MNALYEKYFNYIIGVIENQIEKNIKHDSYDQEFNLKLKNKINAINKIKKEEILYFQKDDESSTMFVIYMILLFAFLLYTYLYIQGVFHDIDGISYFCINFATVISSYILGSLSAKAKANSEINGTINSLDVVTSDHVFRFSGGPLCEIYLRSEIFSVIRHKKGYITASELYKSEIEFFNGEKISLGNPSESFLKAIEGKK